MVFEKLSNSIASYITQTLKYDKDKKEVIAYGAYILLDTVLSLSMVLIFGALLGVFIESLVVSFSAAILRKTSGGAHSTTPLRCASIGAVVAVGFALIIKSIKPLLGIWQTIMYFIVTFVVSFVIIKKLAPKDSPNKPIVKEEKIKELKAKSVRTLCIYGIICIAVLLINFNMRTTDYLYYTVLICTGYTWQAFTLTSIGHKTVEKMELPFRYINYIGGGKQ